ncbi:MAG TPA: M4 family metallopeptidase [Candidatus Cybelea sp.]|nr:M4 family metallopeptidase [Candidatus Cybelea sp.]
MKTCPYCKEDVRDDAIKCRHCQSMLLALDPAVATEPADSDRGQVTYVLDRGLIRFGKFVVAVLGIFLVVGLYLYGYRLEDALDQARKTQDELNTLHGSMQASQDQVAAQAKEIKEAQAQLESSLADVKRQSDDVTRLHDAAGNMMKDIGAQRDGVATLRDDVTKLHDEAGTLIIQIRGNASTAQTLIAQLSPPPPSAGSTGLDAGRVNQVMAKQLLVVMKGVLPDAQYAALQKQLKSETTTGLQRKIYDAKNGESLPGKLILSEGEDASRKDKEVQEVYDDLGTVYDFFKSNYDRDITADTGGTMVATIHYGTKYDNTFWDGEELAIGDGDGTMFRAGGFASLDIIAAELSHSVITTSTGLNYEGIQGAIHSHLTDVFSSLIVQWKNRQTVDTASWVIGEHVLAPGIKGVGLRSLKAPGTAYDDPALGKDHQPDNIGNVYTGTDDNGGVHLNSGIPNKAFYEAAKRIGGFAWEKTGRIWYQSMLKARGVNKFEDFAKITYATAGDLYGAQSSEQAAVKGGWNAVGISVEP